MTIIALGVWAIAVVAIGVLSILSTSSNNFLYEKIFGIHIVVLIVTIMMIIGMIIYRIFGKREIYE
jgi:hypothetical protein